jgi:hypothetical protein
MSDKDRRDRIVQLTELTLSGGALAISIIALITSLTTAKQSNEISTQALAVAKQANDIAVGRAREYPQIAIESYTQDVKFASPDDVKRNEVVWFVENEGNTPISGFQVKVVGLSGLTYSLENPQEQHRDLPTSSQQIKFDEQLTPKGFVRLDIKRTVIDYLRNLSL